MGTNDSAISAEDRKTDVGKLDDLLVKEMEETNNWARLGFQVYFAWFALQFTVNSVAMFGIFTHRGELTIASIRLAASIFIGWNLMGTLQTFFTRRDLLDQDLRIKEVIETQTRRHVAESPSSWARSPMPQRGIEKAFAVCAVTNCMSVVFWTALLIWPQILGASPPVSH